MPRHTLDKWTYKLKTMDVCITQHTEDDVYDHMIKMSSRMQELFEKYDTKYNTILTELNSDENNIYYHKNYNWRLGSPSRFWLKNADKWYLIDVSENDKEDVLNEFLLMYQIWADFMICDKYIHEWNEEKPEWSNMVYDITKMQNIMKNSFDTIKIYEQNSFTENKTKWMMIDKDWIDENDRKKDHKHHLRIELPSPTNIETQPESYPTEPLRDDCIYCRQHWEETKPRYELAVQIWLKNKKENEEWKHQAELEDVKMRKANEQKVKQYQEWKEKQEPIDLYCHDCEYEAKNESDLKRHTLSEEHTEKSRYCSCCDLQCRSEYDFKNHNSSSKHKKKAGLIDTTPITYKCNQCDYTSKVKCNYERHLLLKHNS
jgi:hypothetical protein